MALNTMLDLVALFYSNGYHQNVSQKKKKIYIYIYIYKIIIRR